MAAKDPGDPVPGQWLDISDPGRYQRLVKLARRHLVGREHHAEDVVSRALIKWTTISADRASVARIEQVIKSEAHSLRRSEDRLANRENRVGSDRSLARSTDYGNPDLALLRVALADTCRREHISMTAADIEVLELLFAGLSVEGTARIMDLARHQVKSSRTKWRLVVRLTRSDPLVEGSPT
jgi:hypothetical protein